MCGPHPSLTALILATAFFADGPEVRADAGPAKAGGQAVIAGKILGTSAVAVGGARVALYRLEAVRWGRFQIVRERAETDGTGTYRFEGLEDGYYMVSAEGAGFARGLRSAQVQDQASQQVDVILKPPASFVIHVVDQEGKPVAGARVREIKGRGVNGECRLPQVWMRSLGVSIPPSDDQGRLRLPLPSGDVVEATLEHLTLAPVRIGELTMASGGTARVTMQPGVVVRLHAPVGPPAERITSAVIDLRHEPFESPSTVIRYEIDFDPEGIARLTLEPGNYSWFLLQNEHFFLTPIYSASHQKKDWLRIEPGRNQDLHVDVHRKVPVRGRVIDAETGKPLDKVSVMGELAHGAPRGWDDPPPGRWSFAGWSETDAEGWYTIDLAAGSARVSFEGSERVAEQDHYELTVAAGGSSVAPEIRVRPLPKVAGVVKNPDGTPAARSVVRLRGKSMNALQPVLADAAGRFELQPYYLPIDEETGRRAVVQQVVAFDPYSPLAARAEVRLDQPNEVVLTLEEHAADWPLLAFATEMAEWERGVVPADRAARDAARSLRGQTPPDLDGVLWLNTNNQGLQLASLRGKYVLLDFWFTGCGPCHYDFPSVRLVHELYRDRGVVVIGVHNNSSTAEAVREHVTKIGLPFPVVVDHPDGRTIARFEKHGLPDGYPDYVLISPEGKVLLDDRTIPHPSLRGYKLEIIRKLLLESEARK